MDMTAAARTVPRRRRAGPRRARRHLPADQRRLQPDQRPGQRCGGATAPRRPSSCAATRRPAAACSSATATPSGSCCGRCPGSRSVATAPALAGTTRPASTSGAKCIVMDCADADVAAGRAGARATTSGRCPTCSSTPSRRSTARRSIDCPRGMPRPADWTAYLDGVLATYDRVADRAPVGRHRCCGTSPGGRAAHRPPPVPLGLVHGDCQPSNVLVADGAAPLVIDWEFAHIGDPREDLGYYTQIPLLPNVYWSDPQRFLRPLPRGHRADRGTAQPGRRRLLPDHRDGHAATSSCSTPPLRSARTSDPASWRRYLINAISHQHDMFLSICDRLS